MVLGDGRGGPELEKSRFVQDAIAQLDSSALRGNVIENGIAPLGLQSNQVFRLGLHAGRT